MNWKAEMPSSNSFILKTSTGYVVCVCGEGVTGPHSVLRPCPTSHGEKHFQVAAKRRALGPAFPELEVLGGGGPPKGSKCVSF